MGDRFLGEELGWSWGRTDSNHSWRASIMLDRLRVTTAAVISKFAQLGRLSRPWRGARLGLAGLVLGGLTPWVPVAAWDVQIYGAVDVGVAYNHVSLGPQSRLPGYRGSQIVMDSNVLDDSFLGFRGRSALGDGWQVTFDLASQINLVNGELALPAFFGYESTLGVTQAQMGELKLGRQRSISTKFVGQIDPMQLSFGQADMGSSFAAVNTQYYNNLIQYTSPNWHGLQAGIGYSFNTGDVAVYTNSPNPSALNLRPAFGTMNQVRALSAAIQYKRGPWLAVASYDTVFGSDRVPSPTDPAMYVSNTNLSNPKAWYFGLNYTLGNWVLSGAWGRGIHGMLSGSGAGDGVSPTPLPTPTGGGDILFSNGFNQTSYLLGLTWNADSRTQVMASWQMLKPDGPLPGIAAQGSQQVLGAALIHNLSPRVSVYAYTSYATNFQMFKGANSFVVGSGIQTLF